jgi:5'-3' exonuclease
MGIKSFSKIFAGKEVRFKDFKNSKIAIDASIIMYQAALGMRNINALTDANGKPTIHINVVIAKCLNFQKHGISPVWVFDYHENGYVNPVKMIEIEKRNNIKKESERKLKLLKEQKDNNDDLFSSDEEIDEKIQSQERVGFSMTSGIVNDIKFILDCFCIPWCDSPKGIEAESICASLTNNESDPHSNPMRCDAVWTTDTDAIVYGAKQIIRELKIKQKKVLMSYKLSDILYDNTLTMDNLRTVAVIAGCDHCTKTPRIGPKTILKKYKTTELTDEQQKAKHVFENTYNISNLKWNNINDDAFKDQTKIKQLLDWAENRNFNRDRLVKQFNKALK